MPTSKRKPNEFLSERESKAVRESPLLRQSSQELHERSKRLVAENRASLEELQSITDKIIKTAESEKFMKMPKSPFSTKLSKIAGRASKLLTKYGPKTARKIK